MVQQKERPPPLAALPLSIMSRPFRRPLASACFRFLRQPAKPNALTPVAKSGRAAGSGVALGGEGKDACRITVEPNGDGKWQVWYSHGACFKSHLAVLPKAPGFFRPSPLLIGSKPVSTLQTQPLGQPEARK
jgi:hypothetical protein